MEGQQLKWTVKVTGDPFPKVTWLRDGMEIPNCDEVRLVDVIMILGIQMTHIFRKETASIHSSSSELKPPIVASSLV